VADPLKSRLKVLKVIEGTLSDFAVPVDRVAYDRGVGGLAGVLNLMLGFGAQNPIVALKHD
jgi:hypothetical protein